MAASMLAQLPRRAAIRVAAPSARRLFSSVGSDTASGAAFVAGAAGVGVGAAVAFFALPRGDKIEAVVEVPPVPVVDLQPLEQRLVELEARPSAPTVDVTPLEQRIGDLEVALASSTHSAFVFIKPHAVYEKVKALAKEKFAKSGISIISEGSIPAERIDEQQLIDTHYGAIAAKAVKLKPDTLTVQPKAKEEFSKLFGISWEDALKEGLVFNAMDAAAKLGVTPTELGEKYDKLGKGVDLIKFGGGFYCGRVDGIYVINGFYMNMRSKFTAPGTSIYFYEVEWDPKTLPWADFRGKVLGGTDPKTAEPGSLRNTIYASWEELGLASVPDTGDNGVHASASPFEALAERNNWLGVPLQKDLFGKALLAKGVPLETVQAWLEDPAVPFEGKKQSLFDLLEDLDSRDCLKKAAAIATAV